MALAHRPEPDVVGGDPDAVDAEGGGRPTAAAGGAGAGPVVPCARDDRPRRLALPPPWGR